MSFINPKKQSEHADYNITNNGGLVVSIGKGPTAADTLGDKLTETPGSGEAPGVNKTIKQGEL